MIPTLNEIREAESNKLVTIRSHPQDSRLVIINYTPTCIYSQAWNETTTRCRGLILWLDASWEEATRIKEVTALPFEKFFNYGEGGRYPESELIEVSEKMDGSLGILYHIYGEHRIATRGSFESEQAIWATNYLQENCQMSLFPFDTTLLFEIVYPDNKIITDYGGRRELTLLAARSVLTGEEWEAIDLDAIAGWCGFGRPRTYHNLGISELLESAKSLGSDFEGWVCRFADGSRFKIKSKGYLELAKALKGLSPRRIFEAMVSGEIDELEMNTPEEALPDVQEWRQRIQLRYDDILASVESGYQDSPKESMKEFAFWVMQNPAKSAPGFEHIYFAKHKGYDVSSAIWKYMDNKRMWE